MAKDELICANCYTVGMPRKYTKGSFWIEVLLWLVFFPVGLIYSIWRLTSRTWVCRHCGAGSMVPLQTPAGKMLQENARRYAY